MNVTNHPANAMARQKQEEDMLAKGYEFLGSAGGKIWELERGNRVGYKIVDAVVSVCGLGVWVKVEKPNSG